MHTPRKAHINSNIAKKDFISLTAQQLFSQVNTGFLQDSVDQEALTLSKCLWRLQDLANFCISNAAVSPVWEQNLISFMAHPESPTT